MSVVLKKQCLSPTTLGCSIIFIICSSRFLNRLSCSTFFIATCRARPHAHQAAQRRSAMCSKKRTVSRTAHRFARLQAGGLKHHPERAVAHDALSLIVDGLPAGPAARSGADDVPARPGVALYYLPLKHLHAQAISAKCGRARPKLHKPGRRRTSSLPLPSRWSSRRRSSLMLCICRQQSARGAQPGPCRHQATATHLR